MSQTWNINGNSSQIFGVTLNVITVGGPNVTKLYQIFVQVSCLTPANVTYTCATGNGTIALPANGGRGSLVVPITPLIDPETTEVHDLSFIVTGSPSPVTTCTPTFVVTAPQSVNITRSNSGTTGTTISVAVIYTGNCTSASITVTTSSSPTGLTVVTNPTAFMVPPSPAVITETILVQPSTALGQYVVIDTFVSGSVTVSTAIAVRVV